MPGLMGGAGYPADALDRLEREFRAVFPDCMLRRAADTMIGGHAFAPWRAVFEDSPGHWAGVDGEASLHAACRPGKTSTGGGAGDRGDTLRLPCTVRDGHLVLDSPAVGNCVRLGRDELLLTADWTGTFPLYYALSGDGILFCSLLRPLARALASPVDPTGVAEFLREGYTIGERTQFQGIRRLLGGQSLRWARGRPLERAEHSRAHAGEDPAYARREVAAEAAAAALSDAMRSIPASGPATLMVSGGWDSRTLLAVAGAVRPELTLRCYSHGDLASRELHLARRVCALRGLEWHGEPLDDQLYDLDALRLSFDRTGNVVFPHWHRAGRLLADRQLLLAGVFGEMLGGRYWTAHAASGARKALMLFRTLLGPDRRAQMSAAKARAHARSIFETTDRGRPWYLAEGAFADWRSITEATNADTDSCFDRYAARGVSSADAYAEAFQADHTGSRFCNVQLLSCRAHVDIALPMANRRVLEVATHTPFRVRVNNSLNRVIVAGLDRRLLRLPMAATLLPAAVPISLQEASRIVRILGQQGLGALHAASGRRLPLPRLSWPNYAFLRDGTSLRAILGELKLDLWDRQALETRITALRNETALHPFLVMADRIGRILTTDLLLR